MKLNHDLVRLVLIEIEEKAEIGRGLKNGNLSISNYPDDEITYTVQKLNEAGYINARVKTTFGGTVYFIESLTWNGHQFLDNIRDDNIWKQTKGVLSKLSSASLSVVGNVAAQVITNQINKQMGL